MSLPRISFTDTVYLPERLSCPSPGWSPVAPAGPRKMLSAEKHKG